MKILVTGARGFIGKNLVVSLECIRSGKDRVHNINGLQDPSDLEIIPYDVDSPAEALDGACRDCSFVFHLAGINRPDDPAEYRRGNYGLTDQLLLALEKHRNKCPVMLASSVQASLSGRYADSEYGRSKLAGEELLFSYAEKTGAKALVYRFPNVFGKWCRPNYNSAVATFCHNTANGLPVHVNDRNTELELLYIDDLINELLDAINGSEHRCEYDGVTAISGSGGRYCHVPVTYKRTLGEIADWLKLFHEQLQTGRIPEMPIHSFERKLCAAYMSYLPPSEISCPLNMNTDFRGSFTELVRTPDTGQFSVSISKPGIIRGQHWHHTKWEIFVVASGHGLIRERKIGLDEHGDPYPVIEHEVSGARLEAVRMLPGYTHSIINLSDKEDLVTFIWANEPFDPKRPDTFFEEV